MHARTKCSTQLDELNQRIEALLLSTRAAQAEPPAEHTASAKPPALLACKPGHSPSLAAIQMPGFADGPEQSQAQQHGDEAAGDSENREPVQPEKRAIGEEQGRDLAAQQQRRTEKQRAGQHSQHQPIDRGPEPAMIQMDVECPRLHLLQNVDQPPRQHLDQLLDFQSQPSQLAPLPRRRQALQAASCGETAASPPSR